MFINLNVMRCKFYFWLVAIEIILFSCVSPSGFVINGMVEGMQEGEIYLYADLDEDTLARASVVGGKFVLTGRVDDLTSASLVIEDKVEVCVFVEIRQ